MIIITFSKFILAAKRKLRSPRANIQRQRFEFCRNDVRTDVVFCDVASLSRGIRANDKGSHYDVVLACVSSRRERPRMLVTCRYWDGEGNVPALHVEDGVCGLTLAFVDVAAELRLGLVARAARAHAREAAQRVAALPARAVLINNKRRFTLTAPVNSPNHGAYTKTRTTKTKTQN